LRELELFREHLAAERTKRLRAAHTIAVGSTGPADYQRIVAEAKAAEVLAGVIRDLDELDKDTGEFVKKFLMQGDGDEHQQRR